MRDVEIAVIGAGLMGSATALSLARRGRSVVVFDAYEQGHRRGSSHGSARIFRRAYPDPLYVELTAPARDLWHRLESESGESLLTPTGGVDHGAARDPGGLARIMAAAGVAVQLLSSAEASERWPGMVFDGPVLFHAEAGVIDSDRAVAAQCRLAIAQGAEIHHSTPVLRVEPFSSGVRLHTSSGTISASTVVIAAGAWLPSLLGGLVPLPELTVTQQSVFHFAPYDPASYDPTPHDPASYDPASYGPALDLPPFIHDDRLNAYGLPGGRDGGAPGAIKVGLHHYGKITTAADRDGIVDETARDLITGYVKQWLPALNPTPLNETTCLYTTTATEDFVLDRHGPFVVCSPCSGHGAKFAPLIGELTADLATGTGSPNPRFTLSR